MLKTYLNGCLVDASESDTLSGIVVYEVIRVINKKPLFLKEHLQRLHHSLDLRFHFQYDDKITKEAIDQVIQSNQLGCGNIELQINNSKNLLVKIIPHFYPTEEMYKNGVKVGVLKNERTNPNTKEKNQTLRNIANAIMQEKHFYEVLLVDKLGFITEGSRSNVFFIKNNQLFTSPTNAVLQGITREKIFEICYQNKISITETDVALEQLHTFDAAFLTGTSPSVLPIQQIEEFCFKPDNAIIRQIKNHYQICVENDLKQT